MSADNPPKKLFKVINEFEDPFLIKEEREDPSLTSDNELAPGYVAPGVDHRVWVGGTAGSDEDFRESCKFQLGFMIDQGLKRDSVLLDLGCGCLRAGIHFIDYLDKEKYLGLDISEYVVKAGIMHELESGVYEEKKPEFIITNDFDCSAFSKKADFIIANSLFTHLPKDQILACMEKVGSSVDSCKFYATFTQVLESSDNIGEAHYYGGDHSLTYTTEEMSSLGAEAGWESKFIGSWGHPKNSTSGNLRRQMMILFYKS